MTVDLLVRGGTVVTPGATGVADVAIRDGRIVAIGALDPAQAGQVVDATGLHVLPGVIDTQVHFREPGLEHKEDLATGGDCAVLGGVVAVFEMPNTKPATTTQEAIEDKLARARGRMRCDHAFYVGAAASNVADLPHLERLPGVCGVKVFMGSSTGDLLVEDDEGLTAVLRSGRRRVAIHAEDEARLRERKALAERGDPRTHPVWRDELTALTATERAIRAARAAGRKVHILHVTSAEEMAWLKGQKDIASVETTPQHLTLTAPECYEQIGTLAQMNPPIRAARHRDGLWAGVADGTVDVIGSDHAPHTFAEKSKTYPESPSGMPGVQTLLPLLLDHMAQGRLSLDRLVALTSTRAASLFHIRNKGQIAPGFDGDLTIVDLKRRQRIESDWLASRCGWSPFKDRVVTGWPVMTVIRGNLAMREGELLGAPAGRPLEFDLEAAP
ncbi:dihydroorotase [Zavarzinia sp. CC-PAN008]|uniref:dihydroorotase n=1 Tax=Zavarzinia sp. CC-PAN008 TaxID=3243332 RepID=UPI003F745DE8